MDIRKLQRAIVDGLEDVKAQHVAVFNTEHLSPLFERVIIATGASNRQTKSLAASVRDNVRARGLQVMRTEGEENGEWIIVDCGAAVVHIMQPAIRQYYHLEEIWGGKPVRMKLGAEGPVRLVKASEEPHAADAAVSPRYLERKPAGAAKPARQRATARRPATPRNTPRDTPGRPGAAKPAVGKGASRPAAKTPERKAPARKTAAKGTPKKRG
jgi:ribosome-associated protein